MIKLQPRLKKNQIWSLLGNAKGHHCLFSFCRLDCRSYSQAAVCSRAPVPTANAVTLCISATAAAAEAGSAAAAISAATFSCSAITAEPEAAVAASTVRACALRAAAYARTSFESAIKAAATARGTKAANIAAEDIIINSSRNCADQLEPQCSCI